MRTLGIDYGAKRVGLALGDEGGRFATPYEALVVASPERAIEEILPIIEREEVGRLVVGLPLNMDDSVGPAARRVAAWAEDLGRRAKRPVVLVDERLSSFAAEQQLKDRKQHGESITRDRKRKRLDAMAAASFLQAYLDGKLKPLEILKNP